MMRIHQIFPSCALLLVLEWQGYAQTQIDLRTQSKSIDFSSAVSTKPSKAGTTLPATCSTGETYFKTNAPAGQNLYGCTATNIWTVMSSSGSVTSVGLTMPGEFAVSGSPVTGAGTLAVTKSSQAANTVFAGPASGAAAAPAFRNLATQDIPNLSSTYQALSQKNTANGYAGLGAGGKLSLSQGTEVWAAGDLADVTGKQGTAGLVQMFGGGAASAGDCAQFDASGNLVSAGAPCGSGTQGTANYAAVVSAQTSLTITGATHGMGTANLIVECYDNNTPASKIEPDRVSVDATTYDVTVLFATPQSGNCVVNGSGGQVVVASVPSVFGRTGAIAAQAGDYTAAQITNTPAGNIVGTNVQEALNELDGEKAALSHSHSMAGDVTGTTASATVAKLQGRTVASTVPADGQGLVWNAISSQWEPGTVSGGSGVSNLTDVNDFKVVRTSSAILTINQSCTLLKPCMARFRHVTYAFNSSTTATISAGTGTAYIYVSSTGSLTVGTGGALTVSCSGCVLSSDSSFPADSIPLATWTASSGAWGASGGTDQRAFLSSTRLIGGTGITVNEANSTVALDTAVVWVRVAVPATSSSNCNLGEVALDSSYAYFCIGTNAWSRTALSSW